MSASEEFERLFEEVEKGISPGDFNAKLEEISETFPNLRRHTITQRSGKSWCCVFV